MLPEHLINNYASKQRAILFMYRILKYIDYNDFFYCKQYGVWRMATVFK